MKGIIYKITNKVNNKVYIGQTRYTLEFRWRQHQHKKDNTYFHNAIRKYGVDNFSIEILEECDVKDLNSREMFYIAKYDSFKNGYNLTIGGDGNRRLVLDDKYDEIKELYLSGFSSNKISDLYGVDKASIVKLLKSLGVKIRSNALNINNQELQEIIRDYKTGHSLKSIAKRYGCSPTGLKDFLRKKGVDLKDKYEIIKDKEAQEMLINDYLDNILRVEDIIKKYHCTYTTLKKILSLHGIQQKGMGKGPYKISPQECLDAIKMFGDGKTVRQIAKHYKVDVGTIYSLFKRYHVDYLTV
jgi:group I intron endonuclease